MKQSCAFPLPSPVLMPLDEASIYAAWRVANLKFCTEKSLPQLAGEGGRRPEGGIKNQDLSRLVSPVFTALDGPSIDAAWRAQCLRRLAGPVFTPLDGPCVCAAWRAQCLRRLAGQHRINSLQRL